MTDLPSIPDLLDLEHVEPDLYRSSALYDAPWGMFGGQAAAQALYAAGLTVEKRPAAALAARLLRAPR